MAVATISVNFASQSEVLAGVVATKSISPATLLPAISSTGVVQISGGPGIVAIPGSTAGIIGVAPSFTNLNTKTYAASADQIMVYDATATSFYKTPLATLSGAIARIDQASFCINRPLSGDRFVLLRTVFPMQLLTTATYTIYSGNVTSVTISPSGIGSTIAAGSTMTATIGSCTPDAKNIVISFGFKYL